MRSVVVVLPASTWAMMPMFLRFVVMTNPLRRGLRHAADAKSRDRLFRQFAGKSRSAVLRRDHAEAHSRASRATALVNMGDQLVVGTHGQVSDVEERKTPGGEACRGRVGDRKAVAFRIS